MDAHTSRRLRVRFSLRGLLLLMALIGACLMVYRWPWKETKEFEISSASVSIAPWRRAEASDHTERPLHGKTITTYRRNWRGKPVRHGTRQAFVDGRLATETTFYDGVPHGLTRHYDEQGRLTFESTLQNGQMHGPIRIGDGLTWIETGELRHDQRQGPWQTTYALPRGGPQFWACSILGIQAHTGASAADDICICHSKWQNGQRHGEWQWKTPGGELLTTAEYRNDLLIRWNGEPVREQLHRWIADLPREGQLLRRILLQPAAKQNITQYYHRSNKDLWLCIDAPLERSNKRSTHYVIHCDHSLSGFPPLQMREDLDQQTTISDFWFEWALLEGLRLDFRYGGLWLVAADDAADGFRDPTGASSIYFPVNSAQELAWEETVPLFANQTAEPLAWLRYVLADTPIALDLSEVSEFSPPKFAPAVDSWHCKRRRCDALGLVLYRAGLRCEQRGNTIVVKRHWTGLTSYRNRPDGSPSICVLP